MKNNKKDILKEENNPNYLVPALPEAEKEKDLYIRNGTISSGLTKIKTNSYKVEQEISEKDGKPLIKQIPNNRDVIVKASGLIKVTTLQLYDLLLIKYANGQYDNQNYITLTMDEYLNFRKLKKTTAKTAYKQVKEDLETLKSCWITYAQERYTKNNKPITIDKEFTILESNTKGFEDNRIVIRFGETFRDILNQIGRDTYYFKELGAIDSNRDPHAYFIGRHIMEHVRNNIAKKSKNTTILAVRTLLDDCPTIPTYEQVMKSDNRKPYKRIFKPLEEALEDLVDIGILKQFTFHLENGKQIPDEALANYKYKDFIEWRVHFVLNYYPDQTKRIEARTKEIIKAKEKAKKKTKTKKQSHDKAKKEGTI